MDKHGYLPFVTWPPVNFLVSTDPLPPLLVHVVVECSLTINISPKNSPIQKNNNKYFFFKALGISDTLYVLNRLLMVGLRHLVNEESLSDSLRLTWPILIPMRYFNFTCSEYLIIFLSIERYIFLCHPHFKHLINYRRTKIYVGCIVGATFLYNLPIWFERTWTMDENGKITMQNTILRKIHIYTEVYETWMYIVFNLILPLLCLITLNFLLLKKVLIT